MSSGLGRLSPHRNAQDIVPLSSHEHKQARVWAAATKQPNQPRRSVPPNPKPHINNEQDLGTVVVTALNSRAAVLRTHSSSSSSSVPCRHRNTCIPRLSLQTVAVFASPYSYSTYHSHIHSRPRPSGCPSVPHEASGERADVISRPTSNPTL